MYKLRLIPLEKSLGAYSILSLLSFLTPNPLLTIACISVIPFFVLLIRKNELPVLFLALCFQWIAVTIKVFFANAKGFDFLYYHTFPEHIYKALFLSLFGLIVLSLGVWIVVRSANNISNVTLKKLIEKVDIKKALYFYITYSLFASLIGSSFLSLGGLAQLTYILLQFKWSFYLLLFLIIATSNISKYKTILIILIIGEFILGFASYFSSFKEILLFTFIGLLATVKNLSLKKFTVLFLFAVFVFQLGIIWTAIKPDFRMYLSAGERKQTITVSKTEAINKFIDLATAVSDDIKDRSQFYLIDRVSYIDYFSSAISYVPKTVEHENGEVWLKAIMHVLMPRLLFPDKPAIDESVHLTKYTGVIYATGEQGASFSLGYMADSYVDFGPFYMFVPIFLVGVLIGAIYKYFINNSYNQLWGIVLIVPMFHFAGSYETSAIKLFGRLLTYFIVFYVINKYLIPFLDRYISKPIN